MIHCNFFATCIVVIYPANCIKKRAILRHAISCDIAALASNFIEPHYYFIKANNNLHDFEMKNT